MPTPQESWAAYFWPETFDPGTGQGVLCNKFGERDAQALRAREYTETAQRALHLLRGQVEIPQTYDAAHVRAIHRYLFQDVFDWAGEYRTVNMAKGSPRGFANVESGEIERYLGDMHRIVVGADWGGMDRAEFVRTSAEVFAYLNQAHPFREGNGRASKAFMVQVSERSAFTFQFDRVDPARWNEASTYSGPDLFEYRPHFEELLGVFRQVSVERGDHRRMAEREPTGPRSPSLADRIDAAVADLSRREALPDSPQRRGVDRTDREPDGLGRGGGR